MEKQTTHSDFKKSLMLNGKSILEFAKNLKKPDGGTGVSHTAVIRVSQGHDDISWINDAINREIRESRKNYPEFWKKQALSN